MVFEKAISYNDRRIEKPDSTDLRVSKGEEGWKLFLSSCEEKEKGLSLCVCLGTYARGVYFAGRGGMRAWVKLKMRAVEESGWRWDAKEKAVGARPQSLPRICSLVQDPDPGSLERTGENRCQTEEPTGEGWRAQWAMAESYPVGEH